MNLRKIKLLLNQYGIFYLIGCILLLGLKYFYSHAETEELLWILSPTARWVSILSGIPFIYEPRMGYVNHSLRYVIAPSCCGVQFLLVTLATLLFSFVHRLARKKAFLWTLGSILLSYILTIWVNGLRILAAIYIPQFLEDVGYSHPLLTWDRLHTIIGTAVYFIALLIIYRIAERIVLQLSESATGRLLISGCTLPLLWYFLLVLGIPFVNNAYAKNPIQFTEYATVITGVCAVIVLPYSFTMLWAQKRHGN